MKSAMLSVLVAIPDPKLRSVISARFLNEGFEVESADSVEDGERRAVKMRPKVFLVELERDASVAKLIKHWRSLPTLHTAKIVLMLARAEREHVDEALKKGADQVILLGTVHPRDIVKSVAKLLKAE
ncbi:MAG: hypothetical protein WC802_01370 [Patescibacteria group bacterium]|jgi:DNA-binding response OmpR family regulator